MINAKRILVVDDNPADIEILRRLFESFPGWNVEVLAARGSKEAAGALSGSDFDLIFSDYILGMETGVDVVNAVREAGSFAPVIMLTGQGSERVAVEAMRAGVTDYIGKGALDAETLFRSVTKAMETAELRRRVEEYQLKLEELARTDSLTGLHNRRFFMENFEREFKRARRSREPLCVLMMDVDHFKVVNDRHGHLTGDRVLIITAEIIKKILRGTDFACRFGGEEFAVILMNTRLSGAVAMAERLCDEVRAHKHAGDSGEVFHTTCSIGVTEYCPMDGGRAGADGATVETLLKEADLALYRAKESGRDMVVSGKSGDRIEQMLKRSAPSPIEGEEKIS